MDTVTSNQPTPAKPHSFVSGLAWWITLIIAVVALPLFGAIIAMAVTSRSAEQMMIFVVACWLSTWLGMWLMKKSHAHHAIHWPHHHPKQ